MNQFGYLCLAGTEIANIDRVGAYLNNGLGGPNFTVDTSIDCLALRDEIGPFSFPEADPAPWYDPAVEASAEFLGVAPNRIDLQSVFAREVTNRVRHGGILGPLSYRPRILNFTGTLFASSDRGMQYGVRWLNTALTGSCDDCPGDEVLILPTCPEPSDPNPELVYRRLLDAGIVDGPTFNTVGNIAECLLYGVSFQIAAGQPYLFSEPVTIMDAVTLSGTSQCAMASTNEWPGDAALVITLEASAAATDIVIENRVSFDGNCDDLEGMPCWSVTVPELAKGDTLVFDATRLAIEHTEAALKQPRSGLHLISMEGPIRYPEVGPCTDLCVCATAATGTVTMTVEQVGREL